MKRQSKNGAARKQQKQPKAARELKHIRGIDFHPELTCWYLRGKSQTEYEIVEQKSEDEHFVPRRVIATVKLAPGLGENAGRAASLMEAAPELWRMCRSLVMVIDGDTQLPDNQQLAADATMLLTSVADRFPFLYRQIDEDEEALVMRNMVRDAEATARNG